MNHAKEIDAFVHRSFDMYGLDFKQFFNELVDEEEDEGGIPAGGHLEELPLVVGEEVDMELLTQAATALGVSAEALMQMDRDAVRCWYEKYPYFKLRGKFEAARQHSLNFASSPEEMVIDATFNEKYRPENHRRYKGSVKMRLVELLKSYNSVMPGCYHEGSEITRLTIQTNNFTQFEQIAELTESYLSMVSRARELFYRLWDEELPEDEAKEYNFLVSVLGMRDVGYSPTRPIYYETARRFAPIYKQEGYTDYASYIMYRGADFPAFYTCKEFYNHPNLVERVVQEFPSIKVAMGQMAMQAKNFVCTFVWSDEPEPPIDASFDEYLVGVLHSFGDDAPSWYHRVYVAKTDDEIGDDAEYIDRCEKLAAPPSKGGLKLPSFEAQENLKSKKEFAKRTIARFQLLGGANNDRH